VGSTFSIFNASSIFTPITRANKRSLFSPSEHLFFIQCAIFPKHPFCSYIIFPWGNSKPNLLNKFLGFIFYNSSFIVLTLLMQQYHYWQTFCSCILIRQQSQSLPHYLYNIQNLAHMYSNRICLQPL
jgi:hypothetical protein